MPSLPCPCGLVSLATPEGRPAGDERVPATCPRCRRALVLWRRDGQPALDFASDMPDRPITARLEPEADQAAGRAPRPDASPESPDDAPAPRLPPPLPPDARGVFLALGPGPAGRAWTEAALALFSGPGDHARQATGDPVRDLAELRHNVHDLALLADCPENAGLTAETAAWSGPRRRATAVILVTDSAPSLDPEAAFYKSADAVLETARTGEARELLRAALAVVERRRAVLSGLSGPDRR